MKDDEVLMILLAPFLVVFFGPAIAAAIFPEVRSFLLDWHILTTDNVMFPLVDGAGLDLARVLAAASVLALMVFLGVLAGRRIHNRRDSRKGQA